MSSVRPKLGPDVPKVITAWDVATGATVYRTQSGDWSQDLSDAETVTGEAADKALSAAVTDETRILDPYVMEVSDEGGVAGRETLRETIRATGPTTHPDFHKAERGVINA
ncbi:DUF2849 domain-containing protein [Ponticaulis sp.]|uniref:DUF2849 domain-containing protein n=1 Tax=Ponticaulis sp. TaxID=2020902 RepID=UPI000B653C6F|nr:DUF2849 domain-containing protein [Ponticaulis sp.]MAI90762.1 hypothetical protein [Ponticaulis sp.]OUX98988.1 MAG: hypothetical protein CBB65_10000 [Hyphomonadaceae bacterium TMED5]|tara:strand:+ start:47610 stop:47939 length:330 start_codon:yes stop_codon:yes gene_type:complete